MKGPKSGTHVYFTREDVKEAIKSHFNLPNSAEIWVTPSLGGFPSDEYANAKWPTRPEDLAGRQ